MFDTSALPPGRYALHVRAEQAGIQEGLDRAVAFEIVSPPDR